MSRRRRRKPIPAEPVELKIDAFTHDGRGIATLEGKKIFVDGALPGETVVAKYTAVNSRFDEARAESVVEAHVDRVEPVCPHFSICGGCSLQHLSSPAQVQLKQSILAEQLQHFGSQSGSELATVEWVEPITADNQGYRRKARLGVKHVPKKGGNLVGFREKRSSFIANIDTCKVIDTRVDQLIGPLKTMLSELDSRSTTPQIEVAASDDELALVVRHLEPLSEPDLQHWRDFAKQHQIKLYLQPKGPSTVTLLWPEQADVYLSYAHPSFGVTLDFHPMDFTQVNAQVNEKMLSQALDWLDLQPDDRVLDLFCGLGNFTLPIATKAKAVVGVEGDDAMVIRGRHNAEKNALTNVSFHAADLTQDCTGKEWASEGFSKILIDPPRSGALEVISEVARFGAQQIVYVSCNPATLARDAGELTKLGYRLTKAGVMDMFPHTTHVESMALFVKV